jgi:hypothetical protein
MKILSISLAAGAALAFAYSVNLQKEAATSPPIGESSAASQLAASGVPTSSFLGSERNPVDRSRGVAPEPSWRDQGPVEKKSDPALPTAPRVISLNSPPSTASRVNIAQAYAAKTWPNVQTKIVETGPIVKISQLHEGLLVVGGGASIRVDEEGRIRWAKNGIVTIPQGFSTLPKLTSQQAVSAAVSVAGKGAVLSTQNDVDLVVDARPGSAPALAYRVLVPVDATGNGGGTVLVDAKTGAIRDIQEGAFHAKSATVYNTNPLTPKITTKLKALPNGATTLGNTDFKVSSCVDTQMCTKYSGTNGGEFWLQTFSLQQLAQSNAAGDFDATEPASSTAVNDPFTEVQAFHYLTRAMEQFRGLGQVSFASGQMPVLVNYRNDASTCPGPTADGPLTSTYDNAFYTSTGILGQPGIKKALVFGNGSESDLAWDGDIAFHELGHAVMQAKGSLGRNVRDSLGLDVTPGAAHEGLADYLSATVSGDPYIGEWYGQTKRKKPEPLRDLKNSGFKCFDDYVYNHFIGEVHADGIPLSSALWIAREELPSLKRPLLDKAVFNVLGALDEADTFETIANAIVAESNVLLGTADTSKVEARLKERGVFNCKRMLPFPAPAGTDLEQQAGQAYTMFLRSGSALGGIAPAPVQFEVELEFQSNTLATSYDTTCSSVEVYLRPGTPIQWDWTASKATNNATFVGVSSPATKPNENRIVFSGSFAPGKYFVQVANTSSDSNCLLVFDPARKPDGTATAFSTDPMYDPYPQKDGSQRNGVCDLSNTKEDLDCYDEVCTATLPTDPDCSDGVCSLLGVDPDCSPVADGGMAAVCGGDSPPKNCFDGKCSAIPGMKSDADCDGRCTPGTADLDCTSTTETDAGPRVPPREGPRESGVVVVDAGETIPRVDDGQQPPTQAGAMESGADSVRGGCSSVSPSGAMPWGLLACLGLLGRSMRRKK